MQKARRAISAFRFATWEHWIQSARAVSEGLFSGKRLQKPGNTVSISRFWNRAARGSAPPLSRSGLIQRFLYLASSVSGFFSFPLFFRKFWPQPNLTRVRSGMTLMTPQLMKKEMMRSRVVKMPSVPKKAAQMLAPAAIAVAVIREVPLPVTPP